MQGRCSVLRCDAESSAEEVECSGGVTYYVGWVRQVRLSERVTSRYLESLTDVSVWLCSVCWCCILCLE